MPASNVKRKLTIGIAAAAVAAGAGGAYAATHSTSSNPHRAYLNDVAKRLHVSPQQLSGAMRGAALDQIRAAVADGRLTQAQANALERRIARGGGLEFRPHGHWPESRGRFGPHPHAGALRAAAAYLGLSDAQLFEQLSSGKSLRQIALARGKSVSGVEQAIRKAIRQRLDRAVRAKLITEAQEQAVLGQLSKRLNRLVNRSPRFGLGPAGRGAPWPPAPPPGAPAPVAPGA